MLNRLLYAIKNRVLFIKIKGKGTVCDYKRVKEQVLKVLQGPCIEKVEFDVEGVHYMDSTFVGLLLGINKTLKRVNKEPMVICNVSQELLEIFKELEVDQLFQMIQAKSTSDLHYKEILLLPDNETCAEDILEAHKHLQEISPKNQNKFSLLSRILNRHTQNSQKKPKS